MSVTGSDASQQEQIQRNLQDSRHEPVPQIIKYLRAAWDESWQWEGGLKSRDIELLSQILEEAVAQYKTAVTATDPDPEKRSAQDQDNIDHLLELIKLGICGYTDVVRSEVQNHSDDTYSVFSMLQVGPPCSSEKFKTMSEEEKKVWERLITTPRKNIYDDGKICTFQDALARQIGVAICGKQWLSKMQVYFSRIRYNAIDNDGSIFVPFEVEYSGEAWKMARSRQTADELEQKVKTEILDNEARIESISKDPNILRVLQMDQSDQAKSKGSMKVQKSEFLPVEKCDPEYTFVDPPATVKAARFFSPIEAAARELPEDETLQVCVVSLIRWLVSWAEENKVLLTDLRQNTQVVQVVKAAVERAKKVDVANRKESAIAHQLLMHARIALRILCPEDTELVSAKVIYRSITALENIRLCTFSRTLEELFTGLNEAAAGENSGAEGEEPEEEFMMYGHKVDDPAMLRDDPIKLQQFLSKQSVQTALPFCVLEPPFETTKESYHAELPSNVVAFSVVPTAEDLGVSSISVNGVIVTSGCTSQRIPIKIVEKVEVVIVVTAQDGKTTQTYTINVTQIDEATEQKKKRDAIETKKKVDKKRHAVKEANRLNIQDD